MPDFQLFVTLGQKMDKFKNILNHINEQRGFNFSGYREPMIGRRVQKRVLATSCGNVDKYFEFLYLNQLEIDNLVDSLTIKVSHFFRNALTFEYLQKVILPNLITKKLDANDKNLRIWSAGCSLGEEAYSIAIIINEILSKEDVDLQLHIFATDIDKNAIQFAQKGCYNFKSLENVKLGILNKYFSQDENQFVVNSEIRKRIHFSFYDLLDKKSYVPNDSIFGGFDIVFCRNVLIYFNPEYQEIIFDKLYKSLNCNGLLILGEVESPSEKYRNKYKQENNCCKIYTKTK